MFPVKKHYYHIYADGNWQVCVEEHISALKKSGLYDVLGEHIYVGLIGSSGNRGIVKKYLDYWMDRYTLVVEKNSGWEQETQDKLYEDAMSSSEPFKVLYAHTKGAAHQSRENHAWRRIMTKVNVGQWKKAVVLLEEYDAVGALWISDGSPQIFSGAVKGKRGFFAGTFWWANSDYIKVLGYPPRVCRFDSEGWVGESARVVNVNNGATVKLADLPTRDIKIYDMYQPVSNLILHLRQNS